MLKLAEHRRLTGKLYKELPPGAEYGRELVLRAYRKVYKAEGYSEYLPVIEKFLREH